MEDNRWDEEMLMFEYTIIVLARVNRGGSPQIDIISKYLNVN